MLMRSRGISVEKSPSPSTASIDEPSSNSSSMLMQLVKAKIVDVDLFQII